MQTWIAENLKYPEEALKNKITGNVTVIFVVSATGKINDVKVTRSASPLLNPEALRLVNSMPEWNPGVQSGKKVDVYMEIPISFNLK